MNEWIYEHSYIIVGIYLGGFIIAVFSSVAAFKILFELNKLLTEE